MAETLESVIGYRFKNPDLLKLALSHKSFASESGSGAYNERLEFLGDSVLAAVVAHQLFDEYPREAEGGLSKKKSLLVSRPSLAAWGEELGLGAHLLLGVGEETTGGRSRHSLLANAVEAVIGAIYLDGGHVAAAQFVERNWLERMHKPRRPLRDPKTVLQEWAQSRGLPTPVYREVERTGPHHDPQFRVAVDLPGLAPAEGVGGSKRAAEKVAASVMIEREGVSGASNDN